MGWKGTMRAIGAAVRASERESQRRHRQLLKEEKEIDKKETLERAKYEVEVYQNLVERLLSVHKKVPQNVD